MTRPLRILAVDDEPLALDRLKLLLREHQATNLVAVASGCAGALPLIVREEPDLLLLDIKMRDGTAFDLLTSLPIGIAPMVAFVTAYPRYACRAFEVNAIDYLLKPVEPDRLTSLISKANAQRSLITARERAEALQRVVEQLREEDREAAPARYHTELWARQRGGERLRIPVDAIDWIGAQDDYANVHAFGRENLLRISLDRLMQNLDPEQFVRVHRSAVIRADRVAQVTSPRLGGRQAILRDGTRVPIGRVYARHLPWQLTEHLARPR